MRWMLLAAHLQSDTDALRNASVAMTPFLDVPAQSLSWGLCVVTACIMGWIAALAEGRKVGAEVKGEGVPLCSVTAYVLLADDLQTHKLLGGSSERNYKINIKNKFLVPQEDNPK